MNQEERRRFVKNEYADLPNGLRCNFSGALMRHRVTVYSDAPGKFSCSWETAVEVSKRKDRRFRWNELREEQSPWLGVEPSPDQFQTQADYDRVANSNERWW